MQHLLSFAAVLPLLVDLSRKAHICEEAAQESAAVTCFSRYVMAKRRSRIWMTSSASKRGMHAKGFHHFSTAVINGRASRAWRHYQAGRPQAGNHQSVTSRPFPSHYDWGNVISSRRRRRVRISSMPARTTPKKAKRTTFLLLRLTQASRSFPVSVPCQWMHSLVTPIITALRVNFAVVRW